MDEATLELSPRPRKGHIVLFSEHASRSPDLGAVEDGSETHGLPRSTPPPPPPSIPPPSTPPPPPEESREEQTQNRTVVVTTVDYSSIKESEIQHVGELTPKQGLFSAEYIEKEIAQQTAKTNRWMKWLLAQNKGYEIRNLELEKKLKQYESMETDKDSQISRLQTESKQLLSQNMVLNKKLKMICEISGRPDDLIMTIQGA